MISARLRAAQHKRNSKTSISDPARQARQGRIKDMIKGKIASGNNQQKSNTPSKAPFRVRMGPHQAPKQIHRSKEGQVERILRKARKEEPYRMRRNRPSYAEPNLYNI